MARRPKRKPKAASNKAVVKEPAATYTALRLESTRRVFRSDARMAEVLGVDRTQVARWREGRTVPEPENADRIVGLETVVELLTGFLEPESIPKWIGGINAHLGNRRPEDLLREGALSEVIAAIEALKSGSYA